MAGFGQTARGDLMAYVFKGTSLSGKAVNGASNVQGSFWVTLHTGDPGADGQTSNEVSTSGTAYAAQAVTASTWNTPTAANPTVVTNGVAITYAQATGSGFGTVTWAALWNSSSGRLASNFVARG